MNIPFTVARNYGGARECRIDLVSDIDGEIGDSIVVYQAEYSYLNVSPSSFNLNKYYNRVYFTITSNYTSYTIETVNAWIALETVSGSGNTTVYFSVSNNEGVPPSQTVSRFGSIFIKSNGTTIKTISVTQDGDRLQ